MGKAAEFSISCRDALGNYAQGGNADESYTLTPAINDLMIGLSELSSVSLSFTMDTKLYINIRYTPQENMPLDAQTRFLLSGYQLENASGVVSGDLIDKVDVRKHIPKLKDFVNAAYREQTKERTLTLELPVTINPTDDILSFMFNMTIERNSDESLPDNAKRVTTPIYANISTDSNALKAFAEDFEKVLKGFKLARISNSQNKDLYVVKVTKLLDIKITPADNNSPVYLAPRPLSNVPITRTVTFNDLKGESVTQTYNGADADAWGQRFLSDVENVRSTTYAAKLAKYNNDEVSRLLYTKEVLADSVSSYLVPVQNGVFPEDNSAAASVKDRLLKNLTSDISVVAQYHMDFPSEENIRLTAAVSNPNADLRIQSGKLDSNQATLCVFITSVSLYKTGFPLDIKLSIQDMEYNIKTMNGYESSE